MDIHETFEQLLKFNPALSQRGANKGSEYMQSLAYVPHLYFPLLNVFQDIKAVGKHKILVYEQAEKNVSKLLVDMELLCIVFYGYQFVFMKLLIAMTCFIGYHM
jgi:hypothetical protein